jgi:hypothetical protein
MILWTLPMGCRGLIFDCDGTLVDSMPLHYHAWVTILHRYNLELSEADFYQWAGVPVEEIVCRPAHCVRWLPWSILRDAFIGDFP